MPQDHDHPFTFKIDGKTYYPVAYDIRAVSPPWYALRLTLRGGERLFPRVAWDETQTSKKDYQYAFTTIKA